MTTFILPPRSLPCFFVHSFGFGDDSAYSSIDRGVGHTRKRRVATAVQRTYQVAWVLTSAQMQALDAWFEEALLVGHRRFIAKVKTEDGLAYWEALWAGPYSADPFPVAHGVAWRVSGQLIVFGDATTEQPVSGLLAAEYGLELMAEATIAGASMLFAEYGLALELALPLTAEYGLELDEYEPFELLIGDGFKLAIGDGFLLRIE